MDRLLKPLDLVAEIQTVKIKPERLELVAPAFRIPPNTRTCGRALGKTLVFPEVDLVAETRAHVAAGVPGQRPADRVGAVAVMKNVLLGDIRIVPDDFLLESPGRRVMVDLDDLGSDDTFQAVEHDAGAESVDRIGPFGPVA